MYTRTCSYRHTHAHKKKHTHTEDSKHTCSPALLSFLLLFLSPSTFLAFLSLVLSLSLSLSLSLFLSLFLSVFYPPHVIIHTPSPSILSRPPHIHPSPP